MLSLPAVAQSSSLPAIQAEVEQTLGRLNGTSYLNGSALGSVRQELARISSELDDFSYEDGVSDVRLRVQDLLTNLTLDNALSGGNLMAARDELAGISDDLDYLIGPADEWQEYRSAALDYWPDSAAFSGWQADRSFTAETSQTAGELLFTIDNGYTASWTIEGAFSGAPRVSADARSNGELYVIVTSDWGERAFLIEHGGLGPLEYGGQVPPLVVVNEGGDYGNVDVYEQPLLTYPQQNDYLFEFDVTVQPQLHHLFPPYRTWHGHDGESHHWNHWDQWRHEGRPAGEHVDRPAGEHVHHPGGQPGSHDAGAPGSHVGTGDHPNPNGPPHPGGQQNHNGHGHNQTGPGRQTVPPPPPATPDPAQTSPQHGPDQPRPADGNHHHNGGVDHHDGNQNNHHGGSGGRPADNPPSPVPPGQHVDHGNQNGHGGQPGNPPAPPKAAPAPAPPKQAAPPPPRPQPPAPGKHADPAQKGQQPQPPPKPAPKPDPNSDLNNIG